jgi:hypothetical protein
MLQKFQIWLQMEVANEHQALADLSYGYSLRK